MITIALDAGHYKYTPGKRCLKALDTNETREWTLNDRVARYLEFALNEYDDCSVIRVDDRTGETDTPLATRAGSANSAKAGYFISIHHNAGIKGGSGGGVVIYTTKNPNAARTQLQKEVYSNVIEHTGLKGNRGTPLAQENHTVTYRANMPAVLCELGFMDSATDVPIILTEEFAIEAAIGVADALVQIAGLKKKQNTIPLVDSTRRYDTIEEVPVYARDIIQTLINRKIIQGYGKTDANGNPIDMDLSLDMIRMLCFNQKAGLY
ncbi:MAG: N-acetylmuramoyl-L-alanine amidase [Oscillospiraceae bacterium]|nr:N-acetylmuramoyl-L-alanine amidase [Oscillospiraceae bacterium]